MKTDFGTADILSRREAAAFLGVCLTTLDRLDIARTRIRNTEQTKDSGPETVKEQKQ